MFKKLNLRRILVFFTPILILIIMTISPLLTIYYGTDIKLKTIPIDPRDLFRGDYVTLSYDIEEIDVDTIDKNVKRYFDSDDGFGYKVKSYAILEKDKDGYHKVKNISLEEPRNGIYLKGFLRKYSTFEPLDKENAVYENEKGEYVEPQGEYIDVYTMDYNIDKYFVAENTGKELEEASIKGGLTANVRVRKGNAILQNININESKK